MDKKFFTVNLEVTIDGETEEEARLNAIAILMRSKKVSSAGKIEAEV